MTLPVWLAWIVTSPYPVKVKFVPPVIEAYPEPAITLPVTARLESEDITSPTMLVVNCGPGLLNVIVWVPWPIASVTTLVPWYMACALSTIPVTA